MAQLGTVHYKGGGVRGWGGRKGLTGLLVSS